MCVLKMIKNSASERVRERERNDGNASFRRRTREKRERAAHSYIISPSSFQKFKRDDESNKKSPKTNIIITTNARCCKERERKNA